MNMGSEVGADERVVPFDLGVRWDVGAPIPVMYWDETGETYLLFHLRNLDDSGEEVAIVKWIGCAAVLCGLPDETTLDQHRLWGRGLKHYRPNEVLKSTWITELIERDPDPRWTREKRPTFRHFILPFHDSTFECIAMSFEVETMRGSMKDALHRLCELILLNED